MAGAGGSQKTRGLCCGGTEEQNSGHPCLAQRDALAALDHMQLLAQREAASAKPAVMLPWANYNPVMLLPERCAPSPPRPHPQA